MVRQRLFFIIMAFRELSRQRSPLEGARLDHLTADCLHSLIWLLTSLTDSHPDPSQSIRILLCILMSFFLHII